MNIFVLDKDPVKAAQYHNDKHVCKMILESAQLLSTAHHINGGAFTKRDSVLLKPTHVNHPCAKWARETQGNYEWLSELMIALIKEFDSRYKHSHKYAGLSITLMTVPNFANDKWPTVMTPHPQCMPEEYRNPRSAVQAYRAYYFGEKQRMANWREPATVPKWWLEMEKKNAA